MSSWAPTAATGTAPTAHARSSELSPQATGIAVGIFLVALIVYGFSAAWLGRTKSPPEAYFDHLADAFRHGRTYLVGPPSTYDLTRHEGRWYVPFPPLPALLLMPWVAVSGVKNVNTVLFGASVGATNVSLAFVLLQSLAHRGWTSMRLVDNLWLTALWGVGSVHWYMCTLGTVWFVSQICAVTFVLLAAWLATSTGSPWLCGTALALAMLGRPHLILTYPLLVVMGIEARSSQSGTVTPRAWLRWSAAAAVPLAITSVLLLAYNVLRFNSPFDFGYLTQNVAPELANDLRTYGQFSLHYVPRNVFIMLLATPLWDASRHTLLPTVDGMSLLLTTPALVYLTRIRRRSRLVVGAWVSTVSLLVPLLTYYNTGWWQFGYRFSLDFMTPVLVLLAVAAGERVSRPMRLAILAGVAVNGWGVWWFMNPRFFP